VGEGVTVAVGSGCGVLVEVAPMMAPRVAEETGAIDSGGWRLQAEDRRMTNSRHAAVNGLMFSLYRKVWIRSIACETQADNSGIGGEFFDNPVNAC
jgi:hypothetical protein